MKQNKAINNSDVRTASLSLYAKCLVSFALVFAVFTSPYIETVLRLSFSFLISILLYEVCIYPSKNSSHNERMICGMELTSR